MTDLEKYNLQDNVKLSTLHFDDEDDWLQLRTKGIGGSDIGAIMGLNKYTSPLMVYKQKVEGYVKDLSNNTNVKKGKELEDVILQNRVVPMLTAEGYSVGKPDFMIINSDYPFFRANVDGIAYKPGTPYKDNLIIEIKYVSEYAESAWNGPEYCGIPAYYYAQVQLYMLVTGINNAKLIALFDSTWEHKVYNIARDDTFICNMIEAGKRFYVYHMQMQMPPRITMDLDKDAVVAVAKASIDPVAPSDEMNTLVEQYKETSTKIKELEATKSKISDDLLERYQRGEYPSNPKYKVNLAVCKRHDLNKSRLKAEDPTLYEQYCEDSEYPKFTIK